MPSTLTARTARILASAGLVGALMLPAAVPVAAADPVVLNIGDTQGIDSINPYGTALVVGYEAFGLTYDFLVGFGPDAEPAPGFAESWERAADGKSWTFKIREGMKWSDGEPATAQDACFSFQINLDAIAAEENVGLGYIDPSRPAAGVTKAECPDDQTMILTSSDPSDAHPPAVRPDPAEAHLGRQDVQGDRRGQGLRRAAGRVRSVPAPGVEDRRVREVQAQSELLGQAGRGRRDRHPASSAAPTPSSRPSRPARSTTPAARTPSSSTRSRPSRTS